MSDKRSIFEIFADVKREVGPVGKDSKNTQQNFNYRGIDAVVNAAAKALDTHGVITVPMLDQYDYDGNVEVGKNRSLMGHVKLEVTYRFYGPAGDHFDAKVPGEAMDSGDKATAKAMSVAYRIALLQTLNLPTSEADPDSQTYERSPRMSAGDAWESAAPRENGRQQRQASRPAAVQQPPADGEVDKDAQAFADEAFDAETVNDLDSIRDRADKAGKLDAFVRNPSSKNSGKPGPLVIYLDWKRTQVTPKAVAS